MAYSRGFNFDQGNLGRNLELLDRRTRDFLADDLDEHTTAGEAEMKLEAPWKDRTGDARRGLWADNTKTDHNFKIHMGHSMEYGVYLEESNGGEYQIVMPTLLKTARSFMRSLERMFLQLEARTPPVVAPGTGGRRGTSQGARERLGGAQTRPTLGVDKRGRVYAKGAKGRFVSVKNMVTSTVTKKTKKTKRG